MLQNSRYGPAYEFEFTITTVFGFTVPFDSVPEGLETRMSMQSGLSHQRPIPPNRTPANVQNAMIERTVRKVDVHCGPGRSFDSAHSRIQLMLLATRAGRRTYDKNLGAMPLSDAEIARNLRRKVGNTMDIGTDSITARRGEEESAEDA